MREFTLDKIREVIKIAEVKKTIGNVTLSIYNSGIFQTDQGQNINFDRGIKIKVGKAQLKLGARELLSLKAILEDGKVREELQERYNEEEEILQGMSF